MRCLHLTFFQFLNPSIINAIHPKFLNGLLKRKYGKQKVASLLGEYSSHEENNVKPRRLKYMKMTF